MRPLIRTFGWYLYGGISCYWLQRILMDFVHLDQNHNELFQLGDIVILDKWNRLALNRNDLICVKSPDNHHDTIFGRVIAVTDDTINIQPKNTRVKLVRIPKGSVAISLLTNNNNDKHEEIKIVPMGLIEGKTLARIWPPKRFNSRLRIMPSTPDI
ncbi:unnamed protein product [Adineta ricciae]|uniref:Uncharacterized protein n=1 Tax=Adineta ricciae TaxID=249248 RepID=A0A815U277_ADIRI|nr:unnamed protein product [Adineta ricciae]